MRTVLVILNRICIRSLALFSSISCIFWESVEAILCLNKRNPKEGVRQVFLVSLRETSLVKLPAMGKGGQLLSCLNTRWGARGWRWREWAYALSWPGQTFRHVHSPWFAIRKVQYEGRGCDSAPKVVMFLQPPSLLWGSSETLNKAAMFALLLSCSFVCAHGYF